MLAAAVFWVSTLLLAYVYVGYPGLVWTWASLRQRRARAARDGAPAGGAAAPEGVDASPLVTVLVIAHDEAANVAARIENLLAQEYPADRLEIVLASDGSSDATAERARAYEPAGVTVTAFETWRGKPAVLNDLVPKARGEIVVLADARQRFEPGTVRALVDALRDPGVGAVSGELCFAAGPGTPVGGGVGVYWRYEKLIRRSESRIDSTIGATGAVYAIRRGLFERLPEDTILDDVLVPLRIARRGYRVLFEPRARAWDRAAETARQEFGRKTRTLAGNFQMFARERWLLHPRRNRLWWQTVSHKGLRLLGPVLHAGALGASLALAGSPPYRALLLAQLGFYGAAAAGALARRRVPLLSAPYVLCLLNAATVAGFLRFARGRQQATWDRGAPC